jgi:hypothetical protein
MAAITPLPFAIGMLLALGLFVALTWFLVNESRRPVHWPEPVRDDPHVSHPRVAVICVLFALWSLWATARPVSGWR